jgi:hypothetical protein
MLFNQGIQTHENVYKRISCFTLFTAFVQSTILYLTPHFHIISCSTFRYHVALALKMSNPNFGATTTAEEVASTYSSQIKGKTSTQILQVLVTLFDQAPTNYI